MSHVLDKLAGSTHRVFGRSAPHAAGRRFERLGLSPEFLRAQITEAKKRLAQLMREQQKINE